MKDSDGVYTRKDRSGYWMHWTDAQGRRKWRKLNVRTLQQARKARAAELVRVEQSRVLGFAPPGEDTFADVAARFLAHQKVRLTLAAYEREKGIVNEHLANFFSGTVAGIRRVDVQRYITKRAAEVSAHSIQKELNILKHLLRLAIEWEVIPFSPAITVKSPRVPAGRVRYLQPSELRLLLEAAPQWLQPIVALAACTGMRRSEILGLRWLDVDLTNSRILLRQTKNGEGRIVYLNNSAATALRSIRFNTETSPTVLVFSEISSPRQVSVAFARLCRSLKIADFRFHDLRHTAASWLRMKGADIHTVAQLLGHKDLRMAARYQHLSPSFLADAVARLDAAYGGLVLSASPDEKRTATGTN
jgi:integrase